MSITFCRSLLRPAFIAAILCLAAPAVADTITVSVDQAKLVKLPERIATIVVGNPMIADVGRTCSDGICCNLVTSASARPTERKSSLGLLAMLSSGSTAIERIGGGAASDGGEGSGFV